jgi:hypothetical protein
MARHASGMAVCDKKDRGTGLVLWSQVATDLQKCDSVHSGIGRNVIHRQGQLNPIPDCELFEDRGKVSLYRALGDFQGLGYLAITRSYRHLFGHH